mmetsp:Transcript_11606/g.19118  ORF Transcript_11606/g.19118 Transcript_11606/m.19118 type:complete len:164 (+) Transcript_11606:1992-2483(+)
MYVYISSFHTLSYHQCTFTSLAPTRHQTIIIITIIINHILITLQQTFSFRYGYYVVLGRDTRVCSYTMVPAEGGSEIRLTIKHCTFIDSVLDQIAANENTVDVEELAKTGQTWYNLGRGFFKVYGPFMSCDHTIANAERVAVLVQTTGSVVSDTVISFQNIRK